MIKRLKTKKGFTLVELIIAISLLAIIMALMSPLLIKSTRYMADITARVKYQNAASNIMNMLRLHAGNTNKAYIFNGDEAEVSGTMVTGVKMFQTKDDYSSFVLKTNTGEIPIVSEKELDGKKIKVDFECDRTTESGGTVKRMAMLYVTVSVYEDDTDMTYFDSNPNATVYAEFDSSGNPTGAPKPVYQHTSGIYLINIGTSINVPNSRASRILEAISAGTLDKPVKEDGTIVYKDMTEIKEELTLDPLSNVGLSAADVANVLNLDTYKQDYIGSCFMFNEVE